MVSWGKPTAEDKDEKLESTKDTKKEPSKGQEGCSGEHSVTGAKWGESSKMGVTHNVQGSTTGPMCHCTQQLGRTAVTLARALSLA